MCKQIASRSHGKGSTCAGSQFSRVDLEYNNRNFGIETTLISRFIVKADGCGNYGLPCINTAQADCIMYALVCLQFPQLTPANYRPYTT